MASSLRSTFRHTTRVFCVTFSDYANAGRKVGKRTPVPNTRSRPSAPSRENREQIAAIRAWARESGHQVSDRGRISAEVLKAFEDAQRGLAAVG
jgi:Lsr2